MLRAVAVSCEKQCREYRRHVEIESPHGHDAFLINLDQVGKPVAEFLEKHRIS
jgi:homoserine acetyltransferase